MAQPVSSTDHEARWRPDLGDGPVCRYVWEDRVCEARGAHYCRPRADRPVEFFPGVLVHTKGAWARQRFELALWQEHDIVRPLFGEVLWSEEWQRYVRRYRVAIIVLGRKNGKSNFASGTVLLLLVGDDEESAEIYGAAKNTKQAGKVFEPAWRMVELSPVLRRRLKLNKHSRRIYHPDSGSHYQIITADAAGELGHNPHGFVLDEGISQPDGSLWTAMRTAEGARTQPLALMISTETNDPQSWVAGEIDEAERIQEDPSRAPHILAYIRKAPKTDEELARLHRLFPGHPDLPVSTDRWDERNWRWPNPALGEFLSLETLRRDALEARNDPTKEAGFCQFRLNQRQSASTRWISTDLWSDNAGDVWDSAEEGIPELLGGVCWAGLDLSAVLDLTSWCLLFGDGAAWWRHWAPESVMPLLDHHTAGRASVWARDGWLTVTEGETVDYGVVYDDITADAGRFAIARLTYDRWSARPAITEIERRTGLTTAESATTYDRMTSPMKELKAMLADRRLRHFGNPVVSWMADVVEVRTSDDRIRPVKPARDRDAARIDGIVSLAYAVDGWLRRGPEQPKTRRTVRARVVG